jgi:hypothetical protein
MILYILSTLLYSGGLALLVIVLTGGFYLHKAIPVAFPSLKKSYLRTIILAGSYMFFLGLVFGGVAILSIIMF